VPRFHRQNIRTIVLALAVAVASGLVLFPAIRTTSFHQNESSWISSSYHYTDLLLRGDLDRVKWKCEPCGVWGAQQLHLGQWLTGLPLTAYSTSSGRRFGAWWDVRLSFEENRRRGAVPPDDILRVARVASVIGGMLCGVMVFVIGWLVGGDWTGLIAASLVLGNRLFIVSVARAMTDSFYLLFLLGAFLAAMIYSRAEVRSPLRWAVWTGLMAGLACSVKITGIVLGIGALLVALAYRARSGRLVPRQAIAHALAASLSALAVVYALDPYLWPTFSSPARTAVAQAARPEGARDASEDDPASDGRAIHGVFRFPRLFVLWSRYMKKQLADGSGEWDGNRLWVIARRVFFEFATLPGQILILVAGAVFAVRRARAVRPWGGSGPGFVAVAFFLMSYAFLAAFQILNWDRYYLSTVVAECVVVAGAITSLAWAARARLLDRSAARNSS
jgi:4-amino-4-deoxy-L-arabinose transferase-like glycosyltransferase